MGEERTINDPQIRNGKAKNHQQNTEMPALG